MKPEIGQTVKLRSGKTRVITNVVTREELGEGWYVFFDGNENCCYRYNHNHECVIEDCIFIHAYSSVHDIIEIIGGATIINADDCVLLLT